MEKGNALEEAVKSIERMILEDSPNLAKDAFNIVGKKIVTVEGVRHEFDVWVEIDHGEEYKSIFVFECKNWENKVGKNEIIIFSEKLKVVQAQRGFVAAKSFTKDARAQAKRDRRIILLDVTEFAVDNISIPFHFHFLLKEKQHGELKLEARQLDPNGKLAMIELDLENVESSLRGEQLDLAAYAREWIDSCSDTFLSTFPSNKEGEGSQDLESSDEREYTDDELVVNGMSIKRLRLKVSFQIRIVRPAVVSHYEVATRGRILSFAPVSVGEDGHIQASFIERG